MTSSSRDRRIEGEIERLHDCFVAWFNGTMPQTEEAFAAIKDALHPKFVLVSPRAAVDHRDELLASIWGAHGRRPDFEISIENVEVRYDGELVVATYEEWQRDPTEGVRGRLSTVVFEAQEDRLTWMHVHETSLPAPPPSADPVSGESPEGG